MIAVPIKDLKHLKANAIHNREVIGKPGHLQFETEFGTTWINANQSDIVMDYKGVPAPGAADQYPPPARAFELRVKTLKDQSPEGYLALAEWCLTHGLPDKAMSIFDGQVKATENRTDLKGPTKKALEAYVKIKDLLNANVEPMGKAMEWKDRLAYATVTPSQHYAIVHQENVLESAQRRLGFLEMNFKTVYLWFALRGRALPAPTEKMVAVIVGDSSEYRRYRDTFEATNLVSDGFHARRENLAVFSARRLDKASINFEAMIRDVYRVRTKAELFSSKLYEKGPTAPRYVDFCRESTLALVDAALQKEAEIASATHEGTKQIFAETGLLPRNVMAPEWLRFGIAALFEMPKGPFPGGGSQLKVALHPGGGGPNWSYMRYFEELKEKGVINQRNADAAFMNTVLDIHYINARKLEVAERTGKKTSDEGDSKATRSADLYARARTYSWAIVYFLAKARYSEFETLLTELAALPRDAELDELAIMTAFSKAYNIATTDVGGKTADIGKFIAIGDEWFTWMKGQQSPSRSLKIESVTVGPQNPGGGPGFPGGGPGGPGFPGGPMGPGGPGGGGPGK